MSEPVLYTLRRPVEAVFNDRIDDDYWWIPVNHGYAKIHRNDFGTLFTPVRDIQQEIREQFQNLLLDKTGGYTPGDPLIEKRVLAVERILGLMNGDTK